jgi:hypothetical protein
MPSRKDSLSDRQLSALLQGLRGDVAAPADFRARVMQRLQAEGLVKGPALPQATWRTRVSAFFSPKFALGAGALAVLALAYVALSTAPQEARVAPQAPAVVATAPSRKSQPKPVLARAPKPAAAPAPVLAKAPAPMQQAELQGQGPAPAVQGRSDAQPAAASVQVASLKPTVVVVETPIVPQGKSVRPGSEVRNNVVHASRGESALLFVNLQEAGRVRAEVFDRMGNSVSLLYDGDLNSGVSSFRWSGAADKGGMAASGIYMVRVTGPGVDGRHKVLLAK